MGRKGVEKSITLKSPGEALSSFVQPQWRESRPLKTENNAQTLSKQLLNDFEKVQQTTFSSPKIAKNEPLICPNLDQTLNENFKLQSHI